MLFQVVNRRSCLRASAPQSTHDRPGERGQALAELSIVVMLMLVMMMAVFDLGRAFDALVSVTHAARDAARAGMAPTIDTHAARETASDNAAIAAFPALSTSNVTASDTCTADETFTVTVTYTLTAITPLMGNFAMTESIVSRCKNV